MIVIPGNHIDAAANTTNKTGLTQAKPILWQLSSLLSLQRSLLLRLNQAAQRPPNSNTANKELNMALRAKEQGDDDLLPVIQGMRLINWLDAAICVGE